MLPTTFLVVYSEPVIVTLEALRKVLVLVVTSYHRPHHLDSFNESLMSFTLATGHFVRVRSLQTL